MADNIQATPRNYFGGLLSDAYNWMQSPERTQQMQGFASLLGTTGVPQTIERMAYGEPLTNIGRANVPLLKPETADALMTVAPMVGPAARSAEAGLLSAGRAGERYAERVVPQIMERGGMPAQLLGDLSQGSIRPMDVWHGSPHGPFTKFDPSKVGTGEGNQSYGIGAYLASARDVGEGYKKMGISGFAEREADNLIFSKKDVDGAIAAAKKELDYVTSNNAPKSTVNEVKSILKVLENRKAGNDDFGYLYKVDLPDDAISKMVQWETPLSEMDDKLSSVIGPLQSQLMSQPNPNLFKNAKSVGDVIQYSNAVGLNPHEQLTNAGYTGVKYLDQVSRGAGEGTSNFVVFPQYQNLLTIKEINDKAVGGLLD